MISLALALCFQQANLKDIHIVAMPLEKAVIQLSNIYNSPMDVSNLLKDKTIIIDATLVSAEEVRDQIAKALNASWEKKEQLWHLTKSAKQQQADAARAAEMRARFMRKTLDIRKKALDEKPELTAAGSTQLFHQLRNEERKVQEERNGGGPPGPTPTGYGLPNHRLLSRLLLRFGLNRITAVPNGHRVVFALHPNAMQQPMGVDIADILTKYRAEQDTWIKVALPLIKDQEENRGGAVREQHYRSSDQMGYGLDSSFGSIPPEPKDILLTVYCSEDGGYHFRLLGIPSSDGPNYIYEIKGTSYEGAFAGMVAGDFETKPVEGFKLSQESEDFQHFFEEGLDQVAAERRNEFLTKVSDPVTRDPLSFGLTEAMVFDARRYKRNVVALVGDHQLNVFTPIFGDMLFQERFKSIMDEFAAVDEKWIRFFDLPFAEPNLPRYELKRLIGSAKANRRVTIFDRASIAAYRNRNSAISYVERLLEKFAGVSNEQHSDPDALKLLGLLSEGERNAATGPNGIRFAQLNPKAQQHLFECCYYNEHSRIWFINPGKKPAGPTSNEATLLAPSGIAGDSVLRVDIKTKDMIKDPDQAGRGNLMTDAHGWGSTMYQIEHPEDYPGTPFTFDKKRKLYRLKETTFDFKLQVNPDCQWQGTMSSSERSGTDTFTIDNLPEDLKPEFEAGYKQAVEQAKLRRERLKNKNGGGGNSRQN